MNIPVWLLNNEQERELDKVNAFYLQKEAEVRDTSDSKPYRHRYHHLTPSSSRFVSRHS